MTNISLLGGVLHCVSSPTIIINDVYISWEQRGGNLLLNFSFMVLWNWSERGLTVVSFLKISTLKSYSLYPCIPTTAHALLDLLTERETRSHGFSHSFYMFFLQRYRWSSLSTTLYSLLLNPTPEIAIHFIMKMDRVWLYDSKACPPLLFSEHNGKSLFAVWVEKVNICGLFSRVKRVLSRGKEFQKFQSFVTWKRISKIPKHWTLPFVWKLCSLGLVSEHSFFCSKRLHSIDEK